MNLYLIRHAKAGRIGGEITRDADRILTPQGEADALRVGKLLARIDGSVSLVLTSPLLRAVETGRLVARAFPASPTVQPSELLRPGFRHRALLEELAGHPAEESLVLVAHQPDLTQFISWLIADDSSASIDMAPGAVAHVGISQPVPSGEAMLRWLLSPEILQSFFP